MILQVSPGMDAEHRCRAVGVPVDVEFATKPQLARRMLACTLDAGTPGGWVAGDEVYGADPHLCTDLEARGVGYVLAVACDHRVRTEAGSRRADTLAAFLPPRTWQRRSAGPGAKGHRFYDWAWLATQPGQPGHHWLLIRRNRHTKQLAYYRCWSPHPVPLATLAAVAGRRWMIEENFPTGKGLCGLDDHQVRTWTSWYRWTTLAMLALAFLTVLAAEHHRDPPPGDQILLTRNEIHCLLNAPITQPLRGAWHGLRWSTWRRRHQHPASATTSGKPPKGHKDHDLRLEH